MTLLSTGNLTELLLGNSSDKSLQTCKHLLNVLVVDDFALRAADELLDTCQTLTIEMLAQPLVYFVQHTLVKLLTVTLIKDGIDEAALGQISGDDALAHNKSFVAASRTETSNQGTRGTSLCDQTERREGSEQEGVRRGVDEVGVCNEGGAQADNGAVEADDEDLGVFAESIGYVEIEGDKRLQPQLVGIFRVFGLGSRDGNVGSAVTAWVSRRRQERKGTTYAEKKRPLASITVTNTSS